jgi:GPI-anchor transamidase subunit T
MNVKFQGFLHIDGYPPDANQGFDIPSALVSFPEFSSARSYPEIDSSLGSPLLEDFQVNLLKILWT